MKTFTVFYFNPVTHSGYKRVFGNMVDASSFISKLSEFITQVRLEVK